MCQIIKKCRTCDVDKCVCGFGKDGKAYKRDCKKCKADVVKAKRAIEIAARIAPAPPTVKSCSKCKLVLAVEMYGSYKAPSGNMQMSSQCNKCRAAAKSAVRKADPVKSAQYGKDYAAKRRADPIASVHLHELYVKNRAKNIVKIQARELKYSRSHQKENAEYLAKNYLQLKERFKTDPEFYKKFRAQRNAVHDKQMLIPARKLHSTMCSHMHSYFQKTRRTFDIAGCTADEFIKWISFQLVDPLTLQNHGSVWHLDHVRPCASFALMDEDEQKLCYHWSNIQPLEKRENIQKSDKFMIDHLTRQLTRYDTYLIQEKIQDSVWSINRSYRDYIDGASTTVDSQEHEIRGNDLGDSNNVEDWAIRSQDTENRIESLLEHVEAIQQLLQSLKLLFV